MRGTKARLRRPQEERLVFVVGSPRSGTSFTAGAIGELAAFVDLGEVPLLKAAIPHLVDLSEQEQAQEIRHVVQRVRGLALVRRLRGVEQTPETAFVLPAALQAFPAATAVHVVRDGRDVVCSLLERGWLSARRSAESSISPSSGVTKSAAPSQSSRRLEMSPSTSAQPDCAASRGPRPNGS